MQWNMIPKETDRKLRHEKTFNHQTPNFLEEIILLDLVEFWWDKAGIVCYIFERLEIQSEAS